MPDFVGDDFDKAPVTVPPKDDKRGRPKKEVRDSILLRMIRPKLTEHEPVSYTHLTLPTILRV